MKPPVILVDGSSYFYRAFHALPPLTNSKGQATGAIYGVVNMIKRLIKDYQPQQMAVIFDAKGKNFRNDLYPEYKAHRPAMPMDLRSQFEPLVQLLKHMGLPVLAIDNVEADDVIGTLAHQATEHKLDVLISTSDKDMAQLVNNKVSLINTFSNQIFDSAGVKTKFGVYPQSIVDYLTLIGDSVDNIPGVDKCGPKTAVKWLDEYQTLENLLAHSKAISGKIGEALRQAEPNLALFKQLITIKTDVELPVNLSQLIIQATDNKKLIALIEKLEFKTWLRELAQEEPHITQQKITYQLVDTKKALDNLSKILSHSRLFGIDALAEQTDLLDSTLIGLSFFVEDKSFYLDLSESAFRQLSLQTLKPILEDPKIDKLGYNLKQLYHWFKNEAIDCDGLHFDAMLASYIANSGHAHNLETLAFNALQVSLVSLEELTGKGHKKTAYKDLPLEQLAVYLTKRSQVCYELQAYFLSSLSEPLKKILLDIETPLLILLARMERLGVLVDSKALANHGRRLKIRMEALEMEALTLAGHEFNLNSPKQLQEVLYQKLNLPVLAKTPTNQPSTAENVLQELAYDYRLPAVIVEYRQLGKLVSTYIDALPKRVHAQTQRVHTSYNQAVTATGRLSSSEPNLQNIPIRTEEGRLIRKAFVAPKGSVILSADYSQIELRIMAHLSQDPNLLEAFTQELDVHTATASEIFQIPLAEVSHEQRRRAKAVNFGLMYGMSSFGLAKQIGVDREDAQYYMDKYFQQYPKVYEYMERTRRQAHEQGYVETLWGRRLYLPMINHRNLNQKRAAERAAINAPLQGTAADIIKKAMLDIGQWQESLTTNHTKTIMQVHDELLFEVTREEVEQSSKIIKQLMEQAITLSIPLIVSVGTGINWDEAH